VRRERNMPRKRKTEQPPGAGVERAEVVRVLDDWDGDGGNGVDGEGKRLTNEGVLAGGDTQTAGERENLVMSHSGNVSKVVHFNHPPVLDSEGGRLTNEGVLAVDEGDLEDGEERLEGLEDSEEGDEEGLEEGDEEAQVLHPERRGSVQMRVGPELRHLPLPRVSHFRDDLKTASGKCRRFFDYWRDVQSLPYARDRLMCYLYRIWPVMQPDARQVDKLPDWISMEDLLRHYGCGDYHLKLNDAGMKYKTLAICTIKNLGDRDLTAYPPVLNTDQVDVDDPLNKSYVSWARSRGITFPGDALWKANQDAKKEREDTMAESRIADRMLDMIEKGRGAKEEVPGEALARSMELIARAGEIQSGILEKGIDRVMKMTEAKPSAATSMEETLKLAKALMPNTSAEIQSVVNVILGQEARYTDKLFQIQSEQAKHQKEELDELRRQLARLMEVRSNPAAGEVVKPRSLKEQLSELTEVKEVLKEALGIEDGKGGGRGGSNWADNLPLIIQAGTVLFQSAASMMYNYALIKTGTTPGQLGGTTPMQPPPMEAALTDEQREAMAAMGMGGHPNPGPGPQPQPQPRPQPQPQPQQENAMTRAHQFFASITIPILRSYQEGESGADFAARLVDLTDGGFFGPELRGTQVYDQVLEFGLPLVNSLIKTFPPIWSVVGQTPAKWERFIAEFFDARRIWAEQEAADEEADNQPPMAPSKSTPGPAQPPPTGV
jgi:hypothetical protein